MTHHEHLRGGLVRAMIDGRLTWDQEVAALTLAAVCAGCRSRILAAPGGEGYLAQVFGRELLAAEAPLDERSMAEVRYCVDLLETLEGVKPQGWPLRVRNDRRYAPLPLAKILVGYAEEHYHRDLAVSRGAAQAALVILERYHAPEAPGVAPLAAEAWAVLGNAERLASRLATAEEAFARARGWLGRGRPAPRLEARVAELEGSLLRAQRRFEPAVELFERAAGLYGRCGKTAAELRCGVLLAFTEREAGRGEDACRRLERLLPELRRGEAGERLYMAALQNLAVTWAQLGRPQRAKALLPEVAARMEATGEPLTVVRLDWLRALVAQAEGADGDAEAFFRRVQRRLLAAGVTLDVALVSLDLAVLFLERERLAEAAELAGELVPVFRELGIERETAATGLLLLRALQRQQATVEAVQAFAERLRRSG